MLYDINNLKEKIENHESKYTSNEIYIINNNQSLSKLFFLECLQHSDMFTIENYFEILSPFINLNKDFVLKISYDLKINFAKKAIECFYYKNNNYPYDIFINICDSIYLPKDVTTLLKYNLIEYFKKIPQYNFTIENDSDSIIEILLDIKRYDLIENITNVNSALKMKKSLSERLLREFPFNKYKLSENLIDIMDVSDLKMHSYNYLFRLFRQYKNKDELSKILYNKVMLGKDEIIDNLFDYYYFMNEAYTDQEKLNMFKKGVFSFNDYLLRNKLITEEDIFNMYIKVSHINPNLEIKHYFKKEYDYIIAKTLIEDANLEPFFTKRFNIYLKDKELYNLIKDKIINHDIKYQQVLKKFKFKIDFIPDELFSLMVSSGMIKEIINKNDTIEVNNDKVKDLARLLNEVDKYSIKISLNKCYINQDELVKVLISKKDNANIINNLTYIENLNLINDYLYQEKDISFCKSLLRNNINFVLKNKNFLDFYFKDNITCKIFYEYMVNQEDNKNLYTDYIYDKLRNYLAELYGLNAKHIDMLKDISGPQILSYIKHEDIWRVINLDDDKFEKILNLFKYSNYTINDFYQLYDSITERIYRKKNVKDLSIFNEILHYKNENMLEKAKVLILKLYLNTEDNIIDKLIHHGYKTDAKTKDELFSLIESDLSNATNIGLLHFITNEYILAKRKEYHNYHYLENEYVKKDMDINNIVNLKNEFNSSLNDIYENPYKILNLINDNYMDLEINNKILAKYDFENMNIKDIIKQYSKKLFNKKYISFINDLINYNYIKLSNKVKSKIDVINEFNIPYKLDDSRNTDKILYADIIKNNKDYKIEDNLLSEYIYIYLSNLHLDKSKIDTIISTLCGDKKILDEETKQYIPKLVKYLTDIIDKSIKNEKLYHKDILYDKEEHMMLLDRFGIIKRVPILKNSINPLEILLHIDLDLVKNNILENEDNYKDVINIIDKKKIFYFPVPLKEYIEEINLKVNGNQIANFLSNYESIKKYIKQNMQKDISDISTIELIKYIDTYSSVSTIYNVILGDEDARIIKDDPSPNKSLYTQEKKLDESIIYIKNLYSRVDVTVPTFDKEFKTNNNKYLEAVLGEFKSPYNITLGERFGSCMRVGGMGTELLNFCTNNRNGFHIVFKNPVTKKLVSRVSGFRNGNTVFLNELRFSNDSSYSSYDLYDILKQVSEYIIEESNKSTYPILNVMIHKGYATDFIDNKELIDFGIKKVTEGFEKFYIDINTKDIVVKSTEKPFAKIDFNKDNLPSYKTIRNKAVKTEDYYMIAKNVRRIEAIKELLEGKKIRDIDIIDIPNNILYGIYNDDFYIYLNENLEIIGNYIDIDYRAKEEYLKYYDELQEEIKNRKAILNARK